VQIGRVGCVDRKEEVSDLPRAVWDVSPTIRLAKKSPRCWCVGGTSFDVLSSLQQLTGGLEELDRVSGRVIQKDF
jgi:hypothetical protein